MNENKNSMKLENQLTIELISQIQENIYNADSKDNIQNKIKCKIPIANKKLESFYQKIKNKKYFVAKFQKIFNLSLNTKIRMKKSNDNKRIEFIETSLIYLSIYILRNHIINKRHNNIQEYLKVLLFFIYNDVLKIEQFAFMLDLLLKSILHILNNNNNINNSNQIYRIIDEPLLFINDIIKAIINYPFDLKKNNKFIKEIIDLFNYIRFILIIYFSIFIHISKIIFVSLIKNKKSLFKIFLEINYKIQFIFFINNKLILKYSY
jgi:hypothetical protein